MTTAAAGRSVPKIANILLVIALIATAVTQVLYISTGVSGTPGAQVLWRSEAVAFLAIALLGFAWMRAAPLVAGAIVLGGVLNFLQIGIGLTLFGAFEGAEMRGVLGFAFALYHAGKVAFSVAAIVLGGKALGVSGWPKIAGILALLAGLAGLALNLFVVAGGSATFAAGAAGTAATVFLALALGALAPTVRD